MKTIFCGSQQKVMDYERGTVKLFCAIYNKECPYNKPNKAQKKCMDVFFIQEKPMSSNSYEEKE